MGLKNKISPNIVLTINTNDFLEIKMVVKNGLGNILALNSVSKLPKMYITRRNVIFAIEELINEFDIDTIILEESKLFLNKIDKYPDPYVLNNVMLNFSIKVAIEDNYYDKVKYILEYSKYDWRKAVLGHNKYGVDQFKHHIVLSNKYESIELDEFDRGNYYEVLCMSEVVKCDELLNKKYQVNV